MSNRKAISRKEIDSRWFFCGGAGTGSQAQASKYIEGPATRPLTFLRTHRLFFSFSLSPSTSSLPPPTLLPPALLRPLHITLVTHSLPPFLSLSYSRFLLHSTVFIIKIKCKIVPRTSFPNGIKLRARFSPFLSYFAFPSLSLPFSPVLSLCS